MMARGRRQRLATMASAHSEVVAQIASMTSSSSPSTYIFDSELCKGLAREWSWGFMRAAKLQRIAQSAYDDEHRLLQRLQDTYSQNPSLAPIISDIEGSTTLAKFAALGSWGKCPGNCARDLRNILGEPECPPAHEFIAKTKIMKPGPRRSILSDATHVILYPHEIFAHLYKYDRPKWERVFLEKVVYKVYTSSGQSHENDEIPV